MTVVHRNTRMPLWSRMVAWVIALSGLVLALGGGYLLTLGGSGFPATIGLLMLASGVLLLRGRRAGALAYLAVFVLSLIMTLIESGDRFWGWVPRMGYVTVLAFFVALMLPLLFGEAKRGLGWMLAAGCLLFAGGAFVGAFVPHDSELLADAPAAPLLAGGTAAGRAAQQDNEWKAYGRDHDATRYSPLRQITTRNVGQLEVAWTYRTGDLPPPGKPNKWAAETTPIMVGGGLYLCTATNNLIKLDPTTGRELWRFDAGTRYESIPYTAACRGVTHYVSTSSAPGDACHERIVEATLDMRIIAVDAGTGRLCQGFGNGGQVDLTQGMGDWVPGQIAVTSPPPIVNGTVVVNHQVLDNQRRWAPSGVIRGYDAETGAFKWAWDVNHPGGIWREIPGPGQQYSRGTPNSWGTMTGDDSLNMVYVPTGNSAADYYSKTRTAAENRVASSIVALDATTGEEQWVFQTVHLDAWDYDIGSQPTLFEYPGADGAAIPAMFIPTKRGQTFVVDRRTGKPLLPVEERPAPAGDVPENPRAPTQPWSTGMPRLGFPELKEASMWGMTPFDQLYCRIKFRQAHYVGEFTPPMAPPQPWIVYPGYNGGSDWGGVAYDPNRGILVANWNATPMYERLLTRAEADARKLYAIDNPKHQPGKGGAEGPGAMEDTPYAVDVAPFIVPGLDTLCNEPPYGMITAIDMHTRKPIWQRPLGTARANGPFGIPTYMPINVGTPNNGGAALTAGDLVFVAAATDNLIRALDIGTGQELWSDVLPAGGQASPMTYAVDGKQFVVQMAGGHHFMMTPPGDYVVAYSLP
ncbi:MAG TPA: membrane-bound PQQ-dependent dehydrogenase, glucose/quinate/shikimate family [Dokdonella sp.]|uniref:membrane-bound PQQ-dependent dehydrogenase, glucose/quinate/shikimate family n=1 Tax=Dokdonella sp. TaxID=2291710 RepID=UPI002B850E99|nr:membrane-bound PQQ-dependent dehydrogenase, glucose/quinate/shikimate family [Dokdonella sp.]HUD43461.1 membrane-bound PQQ-dependent dehydrogenase, glucose/quinate/shikimate family [Dokdonella sp.]